MNQPTEAMTGRQKFLKKLYPLLLKLGKLFGTKSTMQTNAMQQQPLTSIYNRIIQLNTGKEISLEEWKGKKLLLVNTASNCGYTAQYQDLQTLYEMFPDKLGIIAFPANDFKEQEKGTDAEIAQFCQLNFGVTFPLAKKSQVVAGKEQHPVFQWLSKPEENGWCAQAPEWNFSKYLISEEGVLLRYFAPGISPLDQQVLEAVQQPAH